MSTQSEKGLMSKTKKELVEIILRKDDVERQLKADKESVEKALENAKKDVRNLELKNHTLRDTENDLNAKLDEANKEIEDYQSEISEIKSCYAAMKNNFDNNLRNLGRARRWCTFFVITTIILAATTIIFAVC